MVGRKSSLLMFSWSLVTFHASFIYRSVWKYSWSNIHNHSRAVLDAHWWAWVDCKSTFFSLGRLAWLADFLPTVLPSLILFVDSWSAPVPLSLNPLLYIPYLSIEACCIPSILKVREGLKNNKAFIELGSCDNVQSERSFFKYANWPKLQK